MSPRQFATADEAEMAFYEALEQGDVEAVMAVWATDEELVCIHPGGPRIEGYDAIRESWRHILGPGNRLSIRLSDIQRFEGMLYAVHVVCEWAADPANPRQNPPVFCTNAFLLTDRGWRMVLHHASPAPRLAIGVDAEPREVRGLLH
ncbi:MAG: nuclear transport factor 2 family protein [Pseudomonadota bacterium]|nr:nuclear transport factor 2 family protein [Pseudomonadota bacterium]